MAQRKGKNDASRWTESRLEVAVQWVVERLEGYHVSSYRIVLVVGLWMETCARSGFGHVGCI